MEITIDNFYYLKIFIVQILICFLVIYPHVWEKRWTVIINLTWLGLGLLLNAVGFGLLIYYFGPGP